MTPDRRNPSPSGSARSWIPFGPNPFSGSSQAGVRMASPLTILGSHSVFMASLPERARAPPLSAELTKWGEGASDRPNSS